MTNSALPPVGSTDSSGSQMEECIDRLSALSRGSVEFSAFFRELLTQTVTPGGASQAILWMQVSSGRWSPVGQRPSDVAIDPQTIDQRQALLNQIADSRRARFEAPRNWFPIQSVQQTVGILEAAHPFGRNSASTEFLAALAEIAGEYLVFAELRQLRKWKSQWQQWDQYALRLAASFDLTRVSATIVNDGRMATGCDRVSVLAGRGLTLRAVSGVDRIEPRSSTTRTLERIASQVARSGQPVWSVGEEPAPEAIEKFVRETGYTALGLVPILNEQKRPIAVIAIEQFEAVPNAEAWRARGEQLAQRSSVALQAAVDRSEAPWLRSWSGGRSLAGSIFRPGILFSLLLLAGIVAALCLVRAEFTVTGSAKLWPQQRREVFASTTGIIDKIHVEHATEVQKDQPLLVLRDPELESQTPRIIGEIATVHERLKGIQAARLTGVNSPDAAARARQLVADEEELKQQLLTLEAQKKLIDDRTAELTLISPIAGTVLTWDVTQQLSARPVERGQALLTIGETAGPWIVEVLVEDKEIGPLLKARQTTPDLAVDFTLAAEPGPVYRGRVQDVSLSTQTDGNGLSYIRVQVQFDRGQLPQLRPGATVIPRIHCGQRSLGYVWLHDLIEAVRTRILF
jgi:multidrug efflux pump subunit AcrA (membrane-fusion protein)